MLADGLVLLLAGVDFVTFRVSLSFRNFRQSCQTCPSCRKPRDLHQVHEGEELEDEVEVPVVEGEPEERPLNLRRRCVEMSAESPGMTFVLEDKECNQILS